MTGLVLRLVEEPQFDVDVSELLPENLAAKSVESIRRTRVQQGKRRIPLGDLFEVNGVPGAALTFEDATRKLRRIGAGMTSGTLVVIGNAGDELGANMTGGAIRVDGDAGDYLGSGMRGGAINVSGKTGDFTGGALPHAALGMRDGVICIGKAAGARTGERMRRGLIVLNGNCGSYCGSNMIAGTIVVTGQAAPGVGLGMRRGTIVLLRQPSGIPATFNDCGNYSLAILALLSLYVGTVDRKAFLRLRSVHEVRRFAGDIGCDGQGELLIAAEK